MTDPYYALELEDYSIPSFCSGFTRTYAGTEEQLSDFMKALSATPSAESFQPLFDAYHDWQQMIPTAAAEYNYCKCWNLRLLDVYHVAEIEQSNFSTEHPNTWHYLYLFQADSVRARIVYAQDRNNGVWCRFVRAAFRELRYDSLGLGFTPVRGRFWGHPAMLKYADGVTSGRLFFLEKAFENRQAMLRDIDAPAEIDFSGFMDDILGDG